MHQTTNTDPTVLSPAQKMTIDIAIESLEFLKEVSTATRKPIGSLTRTDLERSVLTSTDKKTSDHVHDVDKPSCVHCGSSATRKEGLGKLRKDGTRSQRWKCRDCDRLMAIG